MIAPRLMIVHCAAALFKKHICLSRLYVKRIACRVGITTMYALVKRKTSYSLVIATRGVCLWDEYKTAVASQDWCGKHRGDQDHHACDKGYLEMLHSSRKELSGRAWRGLA